MFYHLKKLGWSSGFRTIDELSRAHWDETEFRSCSCSICVWSNEDTHNLSPAKRICVFEHSVMTNFNCACPAIQRGQGSGFLSEGSSWLTACMSEQRRFWRDCADAQARLNLRCSHRRISTKFASRGPFNTLAKKPFDYKSSKYP